MKFSLKTNGFDSGVSNTTPEQASSKEYNSEHEHHDDHHETRQRESEERKRRKNARTHRQFLQMQTSQAAVVKFITDEKES